MYSTMKKPKLNDFYLNDARIELDHEGWNNAQEAYKAFLARKAEKNKAYRARRTAREQKAAAEAKALRANRTIDPTREEWLARAAKSILEHVKELGYEPTGEVKVALGICPQKGRSCKTLGVCYHAKASEGGFREIFINPELTDTRVILGVLTHEIGHAVLEDGVGHRKSFRTFCNRVGFDFKKAEHANDGETFWTWAKHIAEDLGNIPHKKLDCSAIAGGKKKQKTRMLLLDCPCCSSKVRTAKGNLTAIQDATALTLARCINPVCDGLIDFGPLLNEIDGEGEEE